MVRALQSGEQRLERKEIGAQLLEGIEFEG